MATPDLTDSGLYRDGFPHDVFRTLRDDAPVYWQPYSEGFPAAPGETGFWVLSRHADVQAANRDAERFRAFDGPQLSHQPEIQGNMLVSLDGHDHTRLRKLVSAGFTPRMIRRLDEQARHWAVSIVDRALELGTCDFVQEVAYQLPMNMIADIVGIPVADREHVFALTNEFLGAASADTPRTRGEYLDLQIELFGYAQQLGESKRSDPQDDVWTLLSTLEVEADDGTRTALTKDELDLFFMLLTVAGSETTRNAIALGLHALSQYPEQFDLMRRDPS